MSVFQPTLLPETADIVLGTQIYQIDSVMSVKPHPFDSPHWTTTHKGVMAGIVVGVLS